MRKRSLLLAAALYVVALHGALAVLVLKTNFLQLVGKTLGWLPPEEWSEQMLRSIIEDADRDRSIRPGAVLLIGDSIIGQLDARLIARNAFNFGVGGSTTRTLLARLRVLRSTDSAAAIVLGVGVGDLRFRQVSEILPDYA